MSVPAEVVQIFLGLKFYSAVPFVIVVFDHLITLDDEINTIWRNPTVGLASKVAFVVNRYLTEAVIAYTVYIFSGTSTSLDIGACRRFIWVFGIACVVAGAISHFIVLLRVYSLWDRRAIVARMLTLAFTGSISAITVLGVFAAIQMQPELSFLEPLHICVLGSTPKVIVGLLGVLSFFDFSLLILVIFNAIDRPRLTQFEIVSGLQKDGLGLFLAIFALRFGDFIFSIFQPLADVFLAITTVWALATIINARLHMRLEGLSLTRPQGPLVMFHDM